MLWPDFIEETKTYLINGLKKYFLVALSAFALILSFPPFDLYFLAWFCLLPFFSSYIKPPITKLFLKVV